MPPLLFPRGVERQVIRERTMAGLQAARAGGRKGGRKAKLTLSQIEIGQALAADRKRTVKEICQTLGIGKTCYRYIHQGK